LPRQRGQCQQHAQQHPAPPRGGGLGVGVGQGAFGAGRQARQPSQGFAKRHVDARADVDRPAVGIQQRPQVALAQLEPGQQHGRPRNHQHQPQQHQRHLPHRQRQKTRHQCGHGGAQSAQRQPDGGKDAGKLGNVEWCGRGGGLAGIGALGAGGGLAHLVGGAGIDGLVAVGGKFLDLVGHQARGALVGAPERLAHAHRVDHHLEHAGVPVAALLVVEHAVAPRHQHLVGVAAGECGHDGDGRLARAGALAVQQVHARQRRQRAVARHVAYAQAQLAAALVDVERAGLEDGGAVAAVEVAQVDEVAQQPHQVAPVVRQALQGLDGVGAGVGGFVLGDEGAQACHGGAIGQLAQGVGGDVGHRGGGACSLPVAQRAQAGREHVPLAGAQVFGRVAQQWLQHRVAQGVQRGLPRRVDALRQRQPGLRRDACQRQRAQFVALHAQGQAGQLGVVRVAGVEGIGGAGVERGQLAAGEVVVHLGLYRLKRGLHGGGDVGAVGRPQGVPVQHLLGVGHKGVEQGLRHTRLAAAVQRRFGAGVGQHVFHQRGHFRIAGGQGQRHHAVAVGVLGHKQAAGVGKVGGLQRGAFGLAQALQHLARRRQQACAFGVVGLQRVQRQCVAGLEQQVGRTQALASPAHRLQQFGHADAAIVVAVEQAQRPGVKLQPAGGAGQHRPQFLVQFAQVLQVLRVVDAHLVKAAAAQEAPAVRFGGGGGGRGGHGRSFFRSFRAPAPRRAASAAAPR
jgi:hypothetical protein